MINQTRAVRGVDSPTHPLRCGRCDVTWRGTTADTCWCCGAPGAPIGDVRIVDDEPAA